MTAKTYTVVRDRFHDHDENWSAFIRMVDNMGKEGWKPSGGVCVIRMDTGDNPGSGPLIHVYQTMVRNKR